MNIPNRDPMPLCYGKCDGGPYDGRALAHYGTAMQLAYERHRPARAHPCFQASDDPDIAWGGYVFNSETQFWKWRAETLWLPIRSAHGFAVDKKGAG